MKNLRIVLFIFITVNFSCQYSSAQKTNCPQNYKKAEQNLKEYLSSKKNITNLKQEHKLVLNDTTFKTIHLLEGEENNHICLNLLENSPWIKNFNHYSFYKSKNYYFIVTYSLTDSTFNRKTIDIINQEYKREVSVMDF